MTKKFIVLIIISCFALLNCVSKSEKEKYVGLWLVDKAYIHDEVAIWNLFSNSFELYKDFTCSLPIADVNDRHTSKEHGEWRIIVDNDTEMLEIRSTNEVFNRTFQILDFRQEEEPINKGIHTKMTLVADSIKFECTKFL
jgi:hypothetical protein